MQKPKVIVLRDKKPDLSELLVTEEGQLSQVRAAHLFNDTDALFRITLRTSFPEVGVVAIKKMLRKKRARKAAYRLPTVAVTAKCDDVAADAIRRMAVSGEWEKLGYARDMSRRSNLGRSKQILSLFARITEEQLSQVLERGNVDMVQKIAEIAPSTVSSKLLKLAADKGDWKTIGYVARTVPVAGMEAIELLGDAKRWRELLPATDSEHKELANEAKRQYLKATPEDVGNAKEWHIVETIWRYGNEETRPVAAKALEERGYGFRMKNNDPTN